MKKEELLKEMHDVLVAIYKKDEAHINKTFAIMIDKILKYVEYVLVNENREINLEEELRQLEQAYVSKDYILTADIIQGSIYQKL